ncbi:MAG TPA: DinB family protein [Ignavibacteria bacterium]|nr:DinB family protein [Ignavibacteria bacterium]
MKKTESEILADIYKKVRDLSKAFIGGLKDVDIDKRMEADGIKFNSAYWIVAHLVWTEHSLILEGIGGENMNIDWLEDYGFGSDPEKIKLKPPYEEVLKKFDEVHVKAVEIIKGLTDEQLEEDNNFGMSFGGSKSKRNLIIHAIRHEPMHIGQISWILKSNGIKFA